MSIRKELQTDPDNLTNYTGRYCDAVDELRYLEEHALPHATTTEEREKISVRIAELKAEFSLGD